jgi:hypothetical protein
MGVDAFPESGVTFHLLARIVKVRVAAPGVTPIRGEA